MATESLTRRWLRLWAWGLLAYTILGLMSATQNAANAVRAGQTVQWSALLANRLLDNWGFALFVPPLFLLAQRYPMDRANWIRSTVVLIAATFAAVMIKCLWVEPLMAGLVPAAGDITGHIFGEMYDMSSIVLVAQAGLFYRRAQERERQAAALREKLTRAQLDALRSQLHPHFLFNTLNAAATLMHSDVAAADRMLTQLSDLLRTTLRQGAADEIPLNEELDLLERYLGIMRVRFKDRLTVVTSVEGEARGALVPQFLLQPLVENALEHGVAERPGPGRVEIAARRENGRLEIAITDDGPGLTGATDDGIGLANTRARLVELYGEAQSLSIAPGDTGGVRVAVSLPWHVPAGRP